MARRNWIENALDYIGSSLSINSDVGSSKASVLPYLFFDASASYLQYFDDFFRYI